jgi:hypothetical protein
MKLQLLPLPSNFDDRLCNCDSVTKMKISGQISSIRHIRRTFSLTIWPLMPELTQNAHLHVRAIGTGFNQLHQIPSPDAVVTFSGTLLAVHNAVAVLSLDEITFLPTAPMQPIDMEAID